MGRQLTKAEERASKKRMERLGYVSNMDNTKTRLARMLLRVLKQRERTAPTSVSSVFAVLLNIAGLGFLTWAGFQLHSVAGLVMAALSCFIVGQMVQRKPQNA